MERVLLCASLLLGHRWALCAATSELGFSVELEGGAADVGISISVLNSNAVYNATHAVGDSANIIRPIVRLTTCSSRVHTADFFLNFTHSLLCLAHPNNATTADGSPTPHWSVEVPEYLERTECIEVSVRELVAGAGVKIAGARKQFWLDPSSLSTFSDVDNLCSQSELGLCEIVDTSVFEWTTVVLLHTDSGWQLHYMYIDEWQAGMETHLPNCIGRQGPAGFGPRWELMEGGATCGDPENTPFTASRVYSLSKNKLLVLGTSLLYSPDKGGSFYQLLWPDPLTEIKDFSVAWDLKFAALVTFNQSSSVWLGFAGEGAVVQVYPSPLVEAVWGAQGLLWNDPELTNTTLEFDDNSDLYLMAGNHSLKLPLSVLLLHSAAAAGYDGQANSSSCGPPELFQEATQRLPLVLGSPPHSLVRCKSATCPFSAMSVEASQCGEVTRSKLHISNDGVLRRMDASLMPKRNCTVKEDALPRDLFLGRGVEYAFTVKFSLSHPDPSLLHFLTEISNSEAMAIRITNHYESATNVLSYQVYLEEKQHYTGQFSSGYTVESIDVQLQVFEARTQCVDVFAKESPQVPGWLQTRVHVGCPPGISLKFDAEASSSQYNQYCQPVDNVTCYYYANEFHPVLLVVDAVTEVESVYTGPYTMTALAGGTTLTNIRHFNKTWRSGLWTPVQPSKGKLKTYYHNDSGIKWVCGTTSPCGEIIPDSADTSEYYLLLEASNLAVAENETYCHLSVQFLIRVHGMGMGAITTVVTLLILLSVLSLHVTCCFAAWHYRLKLAYCKDRAVEKSVQRYSTIKQRVLEHNRQQRAVCQETELREL